jgi:hypothetical protein
MLDQAGRPNMSRLGLVGVSNGCFFFFFFFKECQMDVSYQLNTAY